MLVEISCDLVFQYELFFCPIIYRRYQMSVGLILNLLNEMNKSILCEPVASIILFYTTSSINFIMNLHEFNIIFIIVKMTIFHQHAYNIKLVYSALLTLCFYSSNDVMSN